MYEEFGDDEVVDALLELVDEGVLEMGVDEDGNSIWWLSDAAIASEMSQTVEAKVPRA